MPASGRWKTRNEVLAVLGIAAGVAYVVAFYATRLPTVEQLAQLEEFRRVDVLLYLTRGDLFPDFFLDRWFGDPRSVGMADRVPVLGVAGLILGVATLAGRLLLALFRLDRLLDKLETFVFSSAVGLAAVSTYVLAAGLAGWVRSPVVYAVPGALVVAAAGWLGWGRHAAALAKRAPVAHQPAQPGKDRATRRRPGKRSSEKRGRKEGDSPILAARESGQSPRDGKGKVPFSLRENRDSLPEEFGPRWLWLAVPFGLILVLGGMLPPVDFDVREYHLQAPKEWYQQGQITFMAHNVYANMPAGAGMFALLAMGITGDWWLGALAGKTVVALLPLLTALGLVAAGRRFFSVSAGVVAALVFLSTPWILRVSTDGLVEGVVAMYTLLAIYAAVLWKQSLADNRKTDNRNQEANSRGRKAAGADRPGDDDAGANSERNAPRPSGRGYSSGAKLKSGAGASYALLLLCGYLAGAAVSVKYPPALFLVVPLGVWIVVVRWKSAVGGAKRTGWKPVLRAAGAFSLAVLLGCGLWLGKNWALAGNPSYPLLYEVFGGESWSPEQNAQWNHVHRPSTFAPAALAGDLSKVLLRSEWLSPLLFPLAALALFDRKRRRLVLGLAGYFVFVVAAWWLTTHRIDRFWVPTLSIVALLAGAGACLSGSRPWRVGLAAVLVVVLGMNLVTALTVAVRNQAYCVHLETLRRRPAGHDPWHLVFNAHWDEPGLQPYGPEGRLMAVGDADVFDLTMPVDYATCFNRCPLETLVKGRTPEEIRSELRARRIGCIYVNWSEIDRYRRTGYAFTDFVRPAVLDGLVAQGVLAPLPSIREHEGRAYRVRTD